jgi:hypothetical protein
MAADIMTGVGAVFAQAADPAAMQIKSKIRSVFMVAGLEGRMGCNSSARKLLLSVPGRVGPGGGTETVCEGV